jgi:hypothetical protein
MKAYSKKVQQYTVIVTVMVTGIKSHESHLFIYAGMLTPR